MLFGMGRRALALLVAVAALGVAVVFFLRPRRMPPASSDAPVETSAQPSTPARAPGAARALAPAPPVRIVPPTHSVAASPAPNGAFEGRVVSAADGRAVPFAQLVFARAEEASSVAAGPDGAFRFDARVAGRWSLAAVTAPGFLPFAPAWGASPVSLEARAGEVVRGVTITLTPEVRYQGRVVDERDAPVAGAEVRILGEPGAEAIVALQDRFTSDAQGRFLFAAPEDALLEARKEGFAPGRERVNHAVRVTGRLTIRLESVKAGLLAIDGIVEDGAGAPVAAASITGQARANGAQVQSRSGADGRFRLDGLAPGTWGIVAERAGLAPARAWAQAGSKDVRLRLAAGGCIEGKVRDRRTGKPVAPFTVLVASYRVQAVSVVDPSGRYALEDLPNRTVGLSVIAPGYAPTPEVRVRVPAPGAAPAVADFDLVPAGRLQGVVLSRGSRKPVAGATVEVEGMPASVAIPVRIETATAQDGRFDLAGVSEGAMSLFASAAGHHARVLSVPGVPTGETAGPIEIELTPLEPGEEPRVELAGIGAVLTQDGATLRVVKVFAGGGAAEVGLGPGDEIVWVEGALVAKMAMTEVIPMLRGPEGTTVVLGVVRASDASRTPLQVVVPRRLIRG